MQVKTLPIAIMLFLFAIKTTAQTGSQPFADLGKKVKTLTLTSGKYEEFFDDDSIQQIGSALINIHTMELVKLKLTAQEQKIIDNTSGARFLSVDPLQVKYPFSSPYVYVLDNPIINVDIDGREVLWFQPLTSSKTFKAIIKALNKNDVYLTTVKRFKENQDNLFFQASNKNVGYAMTPSRGKAEDDVTSNGANGYTIYVSTSALVSNNGDLLVDPTYAAKVIIHESTHARFHLIEDQSEANGSPTLNRNMQTQNKVGPGVFQGEHETMGEGDIQRFITGMKEFDKEYGSKHSNNWYEAMAWRGSLMYNNGGSNAYKSLDATKRKLLEQIADNEDLYEGYLQAKSIYNQSKTTANKTAMDAAKNKVDWKLFKKTRQ